MQPSVARIYVGGSGGLAEWDIVGLNALSENGIEVPAEADPRAAFLNALITQHNVAAHIGNFGGDANVAEAEFGPSMGGNRYLATRQNLYEGDFWQETKDRPPAFLFPRVHMPFMGLEPSDFEYLIRCGSIALYIGAEETPIARLAEEPPGEPAVIDGQDFWAARHRVWVEAVTQACQVAVVADHDGQYFACHARTSEDFRLLHGPIATAVEAITSTQWYRDNAARLVWDDGPDMCLKLPQPVSSPSEGN